MAGPGDLLRLLGGGAARSAAGARPANAPQSVLEPGESGFADLLRRAASGELISGITVSVDRDAGVSLSEEQLARLSLAADRAEAAGVHTALAMIDGMALVLDVKTRTVLRQVDPSKDVLTGVDGVVPVPAVGAKDGADAPSVLPPAPGVPANPSLLRLLADNEGAAAKRSA